MKILITGARGQLGQALQSMRNDIDAQIFPVDMSSCDITNPEQVESVVKRISPDTVIHCAAYTAVDRAEVEQEKCWRVNVVGTQNVVCSCRAVHAALMLISTDYVFDGRAEGLYSEEDETAPLNVYGKSKVQAEHILQEGLDRYFILRTSWMFGQGDNFIQTMLRLAETRNEVNVVCDQIGSPTYANDLAKLALRMINTDRYGLYHATNEGYCSWADLAEAVYRGKGLSTKVRHVTSREYGSPALRPQNSRLSKQKLVHNGFDLLPTWQDAVERYLNTL